MSKNALMQTSFVAAIGDHALRTLAVSLTLAILPLHAQAQGNVTLTVEDMEKRIHPIFLSDTDPAYAVVESIQKEFCSRLDTLPCNTQAGRCAIVVLAAYSKKFGEDTSNMKEVSDTLTRLCAFQGTRLETAGSHATLGAALDEIHAAAARRHQSLATKPAIGGLPIREFNASSSAGSLPVILVNQRFESFVADFARIACMSLPVDRTPAGIRIEEALRPSELLIEQSPTLREALIYHLGVYAGHPSDREYESTALCDDVIVVYASTIAAFVIGHEYGHLYLKHPQARTEDLFPLTNEQDGRTANIANSLLVRELQADGFSYRLQEDWFEHLRPSLADVGAAKENYLGAIEFYFLMQGIYAQAVQGGTAKTLMAGSKAYALAHRVAQCYQDPTCDVSSMEPELLLLYDRAEHPPAAFRQAIAHEYRELFLVQHPNDLSKLVDLLNRNAGLLWDASHDEWQRRREEDELLKRAMRASGSQHEALLQAATTHARLLRTREDLLRLAGKFPSAPPFQQGLTQVSGEMGDASEEQGNLAAAREEFEAALDYSRKWLESRPDDNGAKRACAMALKRIGLIQIRQGMRATGFGNLLVGTRILEDALKVAPKDLGIKEDLTDLLSQVINSQIYANDLAPAEGYLNQMQDLLVTMPSPEEAADSRRIVFSELRWKLGCRLQDALNTGAALDSYGKSMGVLKEIVAATPGNSEARLLLAQRGVLLRMHTDKLVSWNEVLMYWEAVDKDHANPEIIDFVTRKSLDQSAGTKLDSLLSGSPCKNENLVVRDARAVPDIR